MVFTSRFSGQMFEMFDVASYGHFWVPGVGGRMMKRQSSGPIAPNTVWVLPFGARTMRRQDAMHLACTLGQRISVKAKRGWLGCIMLVNHLHWSSNAPVLAHLTLMRRGHRDMAPQDRHFLRLYCRAKYWVSVGPTVLAILPKECLF